jgi:DNA (cytosine-5)-methyltransferase 1
VADSNSIGDNGCGLSGPGGWFEHPNGGVPSLVGNSNIAGLEGQDLGRHSANERTLGAPSLVVQRPGPVNGAWAIADWLFCTDGLWRPAESGSSALVDRTAVDMGSLFPDGTHPFRTEGPWAKGMIEGYGNAIVAPLAEMFIRAYMGLK